MKFFTDLKDDINIDLAFDWRNESKLSFFTMYSIIFLGFPIWIPLRIFVISLQTFCNMLRSKCSGDTATNKQIGDSE